MPPLFLVSCLLLSACGGGSQSYTLYRNSPSDANMRIHIATFNAEDKRTYNSENCNLAAKLLAQQPNVTTRFWCEQGRFKK